MSSRPFRFIFILASRRRSAPAWPPSAAGATRAPRRRSADRSSSSPSTRCAPTTCRPTATARSRRRRSTRWPPTASCSSAPTRTRRRRCRRTPRSCPDGCRSRPASATTSASPSRRGERLLPQMLRERGYTTGGVVSAYVLRKETGIDQGFDFFDGEMPPASPELSHRPGAARRRGVRSDRRALARHRSARRARSCSCISTSRTSRTRRRSGSRSTRRTTARSPTPTKSSAGWCSYLKTHQLYDRSTIVLLSDHGEGLGDHGEQEHGLFVYDEAIHVPLIIKQAGNAGAGRRVPDLVQHIDLVPTILDLVKAPARRQPARPLAEAAARRHRPAAPHADLLRGALRALSLRLERADGADRRALSLHQRAARRALRPRAAIRTSGPTSPPIGRSRARRCAARSTASPRGSDDPGAGRRTGRRARAAAGARLCRRADRRDDHARRARCADPKDKRDILERYRAAVDLAGRARVAAGDRAAAADSARRSGDGRRLERSWRCSRRVSTATTSPSTPTSTTSR